MLPRSRSRSVAIAGAALLTVSLGACGSEEAAPSAAAAMPKQVTTSPASPATPATARCAAPPQLPTSVPTFSAAPDKATAAGRTFVATVKTSCGDIVLELDGAKAPQTVASFKQLADKAYWKDSPCHRVTTAGIYVLQCGDPTGSGSGNPGYGYGIENAPPEGSYPAGSLAMARSQDPNSNGGQFFIVYQDSTIDPSGGGYSIFGHVTKGMDILAKIAKAGVNGGGEDGPPAQPISILSVAVTEKKA